MTIDFNILAQAQGYSDFREYIVLSYYLPRTEPTVKSIAEHLGVAESTLLEAMDRENLPRRNKGWTNPRKGFYCEGCGCLTPLLYMRYNVSGGRKLHLCPHCKSILKGGETQKAEREDKPKP